MATTPGYAAIPKCGIAQISAANTNRDGTGTIVDVFTAGSSGSRVEDVTIQATGTTTAGMVRLYLYTGSAYRLLAEIPIDAATPSATARAASAMVTFRNLLMESGQKLGASTHNAETFNLFASGGNF